MPLPLSDEMIPGTVVGRYVVRRTLGRGGMGVVYEAHDPELDRTVALKVLSVVASVTSVAQARLRREAQALAKLSHPNVVAVHDVGTHDGGVFLAMERIEGVTLGEWLDEQPRSWSEVVAMFLQAGEGLAAAHAAGLIHRDFKPDNVIVDRSGRARVLDFGLARAADRSDGEGIAPGAEQDPSTAEAFAKGPVAVIESAETLDAPALASPTTMAPSVSATAATVSSPAGARSDAPISHRSDAPPSSGELLASPLTETGTLLGTPLYMSPEQYSRSATDARTDQFSFCVALYEALYRQRPFKGDNVLQLGRAVRKGEVAPLPRGSAVPERIGRAVLRGLRPAPSDRFPSTSALLAELSPERGPSRRVFVAGGAAALALAAGGVAVAVQSLRARSPAPPVRYEQLTFKGAMNPLLSPDGKRLAFRSAGKLIVRELEGGRERALLELPSTEILHWTSSSELVFVQQPGGPMAVSVEGSPAHEVPFERGRSPDGSRSVAYRANEKTITVTDHRTGGETRIELRGAFTWLSHASLSSSDHGPLLLCTENERQSAFWLVALDGSIQNQVGEEPEPTLLPCWSPRGDAFYYIRQRNELVRVQIEPRSCTAVGPPRTLLTGLDASAGDGAVSTQMAISADGRKLYFARGRDVAHLWLIEPTPGARAARATRLTNNRASRAGLAVSQDGKLAFVGEIDTSARLVAHPVDGGPPRQIAATELSTFDGLACSPDGRELAVTGQGRDGKVSVYRVPVAGGELALLRSGASGGLAWAPGRNIVVQMEGNQNFHVIDPETATARPLLSQENGWVFNPIGLPDGKTVALWWVRSTPRASGVGLISVEGGSLRMLAEGMLSPVGVSLDGASLRVLGEGGRRELHSIALSTGAATPLASLAFEEGVLEIRTMPGTDRFVALVPEGGPDIWVAENFDPELASQ
jgi:serine/threonine protein kinase